MTDTLTFPPLLTGHPVDALIDPFDKACSLAMHGCDAGMIVYAIRPDVLQAAMVFAPEVPLEDATAMLPVCGIGFQNALGALAPPEVAVHLEWDGGIRVNGARCGRMRIAASQDRASEIPDWLVVGVEVPLLPTGNDPGLTPGETTLFAEGCADVSPPRLIESWARHTLVWINRWSSEGAAPVHAEWRSLAHGIGGETSVFGQSGSFLGVDERFGLLLRNSEGTTLFPLSRLLEGTT